MKKIKYLAILPVFVFFVFLVSRCMNQMAKNEEKKDHYKGVISDIYRDPNNHYMNTFSVNSDFGRIEITADLYSHSVDYSSIGDSIIKIKNELYITIKKQIGREKKFYYK